MLAAIAVGGAKAEADAGLPAVPRQPLPTEGGRRTPPAAWGGSGR